MSHNNIFQREVENRVRLLKSVDKVKQELSHVNERVVDLEGKRDRKSWDHNQIARIVKDLTVWNSEIYVDYHHRHLM